MHTGTICVGLDGTTYKSLVEKRFADTYLYNKYEYRYEHPYEMGTKYTCDFYIPNLKLWIEVIPHSPEKLKIVREIPTQIYLKQDSVNNYINKNLDSWKNFLIKNNMLWDSIEKKWYIPKEKYAFWRADANLKNFLYAYNDIVEVKAGEMNKNFETYFERIEKKRKIVEKRYREFFVSIADDQIGDNPNRTLASILYNNMDKKYGWRFFALMETCSPINMLSVEKIQKVDQLEKIIFDMQSEISILKQEKNSLEITLKSLQANFNSMKQASPARQNKGKKKKNKKNNANNGSGSRIRVVRYY